MDWSFLDIFKKADFNTLMFSIALTGWILFDIYPENIYVLTAAILCSVYSVARYFVYLFKYYKRKQIIRENRLQAELQERKKIQKERQQAQYVYDRLSKESKCVISYIVKTATKSSYPNVYMMQDLKSCSQIVSQLRTILHRDSVIDSWVSIDERSENICVHIEPPLNEIIEATIKN